jgi:hypothetical protein
MYGTGSTDSGSGSGDTSTSVETGVPAETGESADTAHPEFQTVRYSLWTPETQCFAGVTGEFAWEYWWPYGDYEGYEVDGEGGCDEISWALADGDNCMVFSKVCHDVDPGSDPAFTRTSEQAAACDALYKAIRELSCE